MADQQVPVWMRQPTVEYWHDCFVCRAKRRALNFHGSLHNRIARLPEVSWRVYRRLGRIVGRNTATRVFRAFRLRIPIPPPRKRGGFCG